MPVAHAHVTESKLVEILKVRSVIMIIECKVSFTTPNVYLLILQAHASESFAAGNELSQAFSKSIIWPCLLVRRTVFDLRSQ